MNKVVCIKHFKSQGLQYELTYGRVYELIENTYGVDDLYSILNDMGYVEFYDKNNFMSLENGERIELINYYNKNGNRRLVS